ncbi:hypothetical protein [Psittacicella hinzii]|uniref:Uncharacterized protein n=1 Tax=Psittacicella hinzii TaxID=2028575 RepID=A0A3A1YT24_9GAMM|nr:hypothetical protein [Psittacicella hinzii]RIY39187.1 hypothetical protein CKF58_02645 [Psittacicella hinzii]
MQKLWRLVGLVGLGIVSIMPSQAGTYFFTHKYLQNPQLSVTDYDYYYGSVDLSALHIDMQRSITQIEKQLNYYTNFTKRDLVQILVSSVPSFSPYLKAIQNNQLTSYKPIAANQTYSQYLNEYVDFCTNQSPMRVKTYRYNCAMLIKVFTLLAQLPDDFIRELNQVAMNPDLARKFSANADRFLRAIGKVEDPDSEANRILKLYYGISITQ